MDIDYAKYLLEKTRRDYDLIAEDFSRTRSNPPRIMEQESLQDYVKNGDRILDLGCGNGRLIEMFKDKNIEYVGLDNSEKMIEIAQNRYPQGKFIFSPALNLPFPDNYFDKVYGLAVFHHISSKDLRLQFLKEIKRVLKPSGLLILTVWYLWKERKIRKIIFKFFFSKIIGKSKLDFKDIFLPWKNSKGEAIAQRYFHCFTKKELIKIGEKANFKIKEAGFIKHPEGHFNLYLVAEKQKSR